MGKEARVAATWVGLTVLVVELVVYLPMAIVKSFDGLNYFGDTLMFCGAVVLLACAMSRKA